MTNRFKQQLDADGFAVIPQVLDRVTIAGLIEDLQQIEPSAATRRRGGSYFGIRNLLNVLPSVYWLANSPELKSIIEPILGKRSRVVRGIFFDKTPEANWKVAWHQDLTIAVKQKKRIDGFTGWSEKAGVTHVQPPTSVLESMVAVRLHLDAAKEESGALNVVPGSHKLGRLSAADIEKIRRETRPHKCCVEEGDAIVMRPLLLHSSSAARKPANRRVIHLEFASTDLPGGLEWQLS